MPPYSPMPPEQPPPEPQVHNPLQVMQAGEQVVCEIKRHPIGLFGIYGSVGFILLLVAIVVYAVVPAVFTDASRSQVLGLGSIVFLFALLFGVTFAFINHVIYWGNRWIVTTDSITQVQQTSLFNKQSSQLSLENLEDVTSAQNGLLAEMFHFGVLRVETAGERSKFMFPFCPNPNHYAQEILNARERFMQDVRIKEEGRFQQPPQYPQQPQPPAPQPPQYPDPNINTEQQ